MNLLLQSIDTELLTFINPEDMLAESLVPGGGIVCQLCRCIAYYTVSSSL